MEPVNVRVLFALIVAVMVSKIQLGHMKEFMLMPLMGKQGF